MAKPSLANITTAQTFQNWFDKTNELVNIFKTNAVTASGSGDTTTGDATLSGDFTATNLIASTLLTSDDIASRSGGSINFQSPVQITGPSATVATFTYGTGGQARFTDGSLSWDVGIESSTPGNFIIDTGVSPTKFELSTAGTLTVPNVVVIEKIVAAEFELDDGTPVGGGAELLQDLTNVTITSPSNGQVLKYNGSAWVNAADATDGGTATDADTLDGINSTQFLRSDINDTASGDYTFSGAVTFSKSSGFGITVGADAEIGGNLEVGGELRVVGDIITAYSASDINLKENLQIINNALDKVSQVNGYTFNYIDRPEERVSGIVAQEIEKVLPEVVFDHERNNETYKAVRYDNVIPLLLEAIKELKGKVDDLENRLNSNGN